MASDGTREVGHVLDEAVNPEPMVVVVEEDDDAAGGRDVDVAGRRHEPGEEPQKVSRQDVEEQRPDQGEEAASIRTDDLLHQSQQALEQNLKHLLHGGRDRPPSGASSPAKQPR